jgi:3-oxoacyl-[acyl-carrier protein] reductase
VVGEITKAGGKAVAIQADVAKRADVERLFKETNEKLGRPNILVNNAGVYKFGPLESLTDEDFHRHFDTNVLGVILAIQAAVRSFDGSGGSVINISTISSVNPSPNSLLYSASKGAIDTITRELALELAGKGIRVNAIAPGMTETEGFTAAGLSVESAKALGFSLPMGRLGKPEDIARVALFFASDQSAWVTGERISASGGQR